MMLRTLNAILLGRACPAAACRPVGRSVCMQAAPIGGSGSSSRGSSGERQRPSENRGGAAGPPGGRRRPSGAPNTKDSSGSNGSSSSPRSGTSPSLGSPSSPGMQRLAKVGVPGAACLPLSTPYTPVPKLSIMNSCHLALLGQAVQPG